MVGRIAALLLLAIQLGAGPGGILYDNLSNSTSSVRSVSAAGPLYDSFSTGASFVSLSDVQLKLRTSEPVRYRPPAAGPGLLLVGYWKPAAQVRSKGFTSRPRPHDDGGLMTVALYADSSTSPGGLLTTIGTLSGDSLSMMPANFDFPLGSVYPLSTNQRYWIGISNTNESIAGWSVAQNNTGVGVPNEFWYANGMVHPNTDPPFQMQVNTVASESIPGTPTPPTLILALVGFGGCALYWIRRRLGFARG
jgi:hypothetical protein